MFSFRLSNRCRRRIILTIIAVCFGIGVAGLIFGLSYSLDRDNFLESSDDFAQRFYPDDSQFLHMSRDPNRSHLAIETRHDSRLWQYLLILAVVLGGVAAFARFFLSRCSDTIEIDGLPDVMRLPSDETKERPNSHVIEMVETSSTRHQGLS